MSQYDSLLNREEETESTKYDQYLDKLSPAPPKPPKNVKNNSGLPWEGYYFSSYGIAVKRGFHGTEEEWLEYLKGVQGATGAAIVSQEKTGETEDGSYIYTQTFDDGTTQTFIAPKGVQGATGPQGEKGDGIAEGGATGQILQKKSNTDYDTEWVDKPNSAVWGNITGTISNQADLQSALAEKADDDDVVHKTGDETISGTKTIFQGAVRFVNEQHEISIGSSGLIIKSSNSPGSSVDGNIILQPSGYTSANAKPIVAVGAPTDDDDAATKKYVDDSVDAVLPAVTNDRYLHTNASTGALEWSEVEQGCNVPTITITIDQAVSLIAPITFRLTNEQAAVVESDDNPFVRIHFDLTNLGYDIKPTFSILKQNGSTKRILSVASSTFVPGTGVSEGLEMYSGVYTPSNKYLVFSTFNISPISAEASWTQSVGIDSSGNLWTAPVNGAVWGNITGTLSSQTDLQAALDAKLAIHQGPENEGKIMKVDANGDLALANFYQITANEAGGNTLTL